VVALAAAEEAAAEWLFGSSLTLSMWWDLRSGPSCADSSKTATSTTKGVAAVVVVVVVVVSSDGEDAATYELRMFER